MTDATVGSPLAGPAIAQALEPRDAWRRPWQRLEDLALALTLTAMVVIPIAEALLRGLLQTGITAAALIVQHLALIAGMLGGAIAAREGRLLLLSTLGDSVLRGRLRAVALAFTGVVGSVVAGLLAVASYQFVLAEQRLGKVLVYGIPVWAVELALPAGFAIIAARLAYRASGRWGARVAATGSAVAIGVLVSTLPDASNRVVALLFCLLALATILGTPAFVTLGGSAMILFWWSADPIAAIPVSHYSLVTNPSIPALPLFTLAG